MNVAGQMLNLYLLVCGVEEGDVPDGENVLIELHQLGKNLMIEGRRKWRRTEGGEQREGERERDGDAKETQGEKGRRKEERGK